MVITTLGWHHHLTNLECSTVARGNFVFCFGDSLHKIQPRFQHRTTFVTNLLLQSQLQCLFQSSDTTDGSTESPTHLWHDVSVDKKWLADYTQQIKDTWWDSNIIDVYNKCIKSDGFDKNKLLTNFNCEFCVQSFMLQQDSFCQAYKHLSDPLHTLIFQPIICR